MEIQGNVKCGNMMISKPTDNDGALYTYADGKTDNIMDYSQFVDVDQQSFFYWQWHTLNVLI